MGLRKLEIKSEYRTKLDNIPRDFIIPLLKEGVSYKRAVGFFSSSALLEISKGIGSLASRGGHIKLIASPKLSEEDVEAISAGYENRKEILRGVVLRELPELDSLNTTEKDRFNLLAYLIASGIMDIRIAFVDDGNGIGIYHEKLAIVEDELGDRVVFTGSMNESKTGMVDNYGAIDVFKSWIDPEGRVPLKEAAFDSIWNNFEVGITTYEFPEVKEAIRDRYLIAEPRFDLDDAYDQDGSGCGSDYANGPIGRPKLPISDFGMREYQPEAVDEWARNGYRGLFDMATGTGKTFTALLALERLYNDKDGDLAVIITCPYQHLVEQWVDELKLFGIKPIVAYSKSSQKGWKQTLSGAVLDRRLNLPSARFICCITTNATLSGEWMQNCLKKLKRNVLFIADEAHNLGAPVYQRVLKDNYSYRLALSATFDRHHDEDGTNVLRDYFGSTCIKYPLEKAIREGMLSKYRYYPIPVTLTENELDKYSQLTRELSKCFEKTGSGKRRLSKRGEIIAQQRARLVAAARNKIPMLKETITPYRKGRHILVYCGAAQLLPEGEDCTQSSDEDRRQITRVVDLLGNELEMRVSKFTSEEDISERETLKEEFRSGNLQALVAIKCLDEGVNIPNIETAFMLASTTNPKEYIQRRGRLLRLSPGKEYAEIYDFITMPYSVGDAAGQTLEELRSVYSLMKNEIERGLEFAQYAMNFGEAQSVLDDIRDSYRIDELKMLVKQDEEEA